MAQETVLVEIIKHCQVFEPGNILELNSEVVEVSPTNKAYFLPDIGNGNSGLLPIKFVKKVKKPFPEKQESYFGKCVLTQVTNFARNSEDDATIDAENIGIIKPQNVRVIHYPDCQQIIFHMPKYAYDAGHFTLTNHVTHEIEKAEIKHKLSGSTMICIDSLPLKPGFYTMEADWPGGWTHKIQFIKFREEFPTAAYPNPLSNIIQVLRNQEAHLLPLQDQVVKDPDISRLTTITPYLGYEHPPGNLRMIQNSKEHRLFDSNGIEIENGPDMVKFKRDLAAKFGPVVEYSQDGRGGNIYYYEGDVSITFWWEFAGGNAVVIIGIPEEEYWEASTKTPLSRRTEILEKMANQVILDKAPGCHFQMYSNTISILR